MSTTYALVFTSNQQPPDVAVSHNELLLAHLLQAAAHPPGLALLSD